VLHASALDEAVWTPRNVTVTPAVAPDGSPTAWRVAEMAVPNNSFRLSQRYLAGEGLHTASVYAKAAERSVLRLRINSAGSLATVAANLADGSLLADSTPGSAAVPVGDGWYRLSVTREITGLDTTVLLILGPDTGALGFYDGNAACGLLVWGVQLEAGPAASTLVGTGATAAARPAESCSLPVDRLPRWSPAAGTLLVEAEVPLAPATPQTLAALSHPDGGNAVRLRLPGGSAVQASAVVDGAPEATLAAGTMTPGARFRAALAWDADGLATCLDGGAVASGGPGAPGGLAALHLGHAGAGGEHARCRLGRVVLYPDRLPDAVLRRLTQA